MLPFVYSAGSGQRSGQNVNNGAEHSYGVDFLTDYYRNYEQEQKSMQERQHERLRERKQANRRRSPRSRSRSRTYSPSRSRSRSRSQSRSRHHRRSRSRSRSHSRDRRYRSRSRSHSRERRRYRGRSRSPRRRSRSNSWDRDRRRDRDDRDYQPAPPSNKLAMMSLPNDVDRHMIAMVMNADGFYPNDVRVVNRGSSRSFGFIDFPDVPSAVTWMDHNKGWLTLNDGRRIAVNYAKPDPQATGRPTNNDWICASCTCNNFFKRDKCFKCETSKSQSDDMERAGMHMIGVTPCDTLLIRSLPAGVSTAAIFEGLIKNINLSCIVQLQLSESRQFAYILMRSPDDALGLINSSYKNPIKVIHQDAILTYCKLSLKEIIRQEQLAQRALTSQPLPSTGGPVSGAEVAHAAMMRLAQNRGDAPVQQNSQQHPYFRHQQQQPPLNMSVPPPAAQKPGIIGSIQTPQGTLPKYVTPNPTTFLLDPPTGYFRDPVTGFLYDPKSGYYFMQENNIWASWDPTYCTYFNMSATATDVKQETTEEAKMTESEKKAADAMKQMQKWQKKQAKQKLQITLKPLSKTLDKKSAFDKPGTSEDFDDIELPNNREDSSKKSVDDEDSDDTRPNSRKSSGDDNPRSTPNLAALREQMEREWIDEAKKICRLCNRAFPSGDVLKKHVDKSDLHRKNADEKRTEWAKQYVGNLIPDEPEVDPEPKIVYRDRAKERRAQFGLDGGYGKEDRPDGFSSKSETKRDPEPATNRPLDSNNIGNKLLKSMGWREGEGAGKYGQGIVNPIEAVQRVQGAGLGSAGSTMVHNSDRTSHKERVRASMMNRYREISEK